MILTKEVEVNLCNRNINIYKEKGYEIPDIIDKNTKINIKVEDLSNGSHVIVESICDNCGKISKNEWCFIVNKRKENGNTYCINCARKLYGGENSHITKLNKGISFSQWCKKNNLDDILNLWNYELNKQTPDEISYSSNKRFWFKSKDNPNNNELKIIGGFVNDYKLKQIPKIPKNFYSFGNWCEDNIGGNLLKKYWSNNNSFSPFEIRYGSSKKILLICQTCNTEITTTPKKFIRYGCTCHKCSDGLSYPNKLMYNVLEQVKIKFETEKIFPWCKYYFNGKYRTGKYDFYFELNNNKYIVEMDGEFHIRDNKMNGRSRRESKFIDNEKDKLANQHGIKIIRIDSVKSDLNYIKSNILKSDLNLILNLNNINWKDCEIYAINSLVKKVCDLWNSGIHNTLIISNILNIHKSTVLKYLKKGTQLKLCNYDVKIARAEGRNNKNIYCVELNKVFINAVEARKDLNIDSSSILKACKNKPKHKTAGGYHWMYYEDYLKQQQLSA